MAVKLVMLAGNPIDGLTVYGPFTDADDADRWAESNHIGEWWLTVLEQPEEKSWQ